MKLISMTDFVLNNPTKFGMEVQSATHQNSNRYISHIRYANFLNQPLKLEMFVPCDEDVNLLKEDLFKNNSNFSTLNPFERAYLDKSKEKVLFEGFEVRKDRGCNWLFNDNQNKGFGSFDKEFFMFFNHYKKIEDLVKYNLTLTHNAEKLIK